MKSQIPSQMFTYIFTLLVIGMLLFLGVRWVGSLLNQQEEISRAKVKVEIENAFEEIKHSYGSWKTKEFVVPSDVERICFLDKDAENIQNTNLCSRRSEDYSPIICDAWKADDQNVVFDPVKSMETSINVKDVSVDSGYLCVNSTNGRVKVKLTGLGDAVGVSLPG